MQHYYYYDYSFLLAVIYVYTYVYVIYNIWIKKIRQNVMVLIFEDEKYLLNELN